MHNIRYILRYEYHFSLLHFSKLKWVIIRILIKFNILTKFALIAHILHCTKKSLVPPKCEIINTFFKWRQQYWTFLFAPWKVILLNLLCFNFSISLLISLSIVIALLTFAIARKGNNDFCCNSWKSNNCMWSYIEKNINQC